MPLIDTEDKVGVLFFNLDPAHRTIASKVDGWLSREGYEVRIAESESEALAFMSLNQPKVIILSSSVEVGAAEVTRLRGDLGYEGVIIVMVTDTEMRRSTRLEFLLMDAGANEVFEVPFDPQLFALRLAGLLDEG